MKQTWMAWVDRKLAAGLCGRCGKQPVHNGRNLCLSCFKKARDRRVKLYHCRLRQGLCPHCGGKRSDPGIIGCRACNDKIAEQRVRLWNRKAKCKYQRNLSRKRRREGTCPVCGQSRDEPGYILCSHCREYGRNQYYNHRSERLAANIRRYNKNHRPKPLCPVCHLHRQTCCLCGKFMKPYHGQESCLYTCKCGNVKSFSVESCRQPVMI